MLLSKILIYIFQAYLLTNSNSWHVPFRMKMKSKYKNMVKLISKTRIYEKFGLTSLEIICKSLKITIITLNVYIFSCTDISRADTTSYDDTIVLTTLNSKISENLNAVEVEDLKSGSTTSTKLFSDEILMKFNDQELGLALTETSYKGFPVVTISRLTNENIGKTQPDLRIGAVITQVGSQKVDGLPLREIGKLVKSLDRPLDIKFRDPSRYILYI